MEVFMKKLTFAGIAVFLVLSLGTCGMGPSGGDDVKGAVEYTDYEYVLLPDGSATLTLYLDDYKVPVTSSNRALNEAMAKRSHDYFEAIFVAGAAANRTIARASWEIGQSAGIRGVKRGVDYSASTAAALATATDAIGVAYICVGRKVANGIGTLLAIGNLTHVAEPGAASVAGSNVTATARSVTFTVSSLTTEVGYDLDDITTGIRDTFVTAATVRPYTGTPAIAATEAALAIFKNNATYTMFGLPGPDKIDTTSTPPANAPNAVPFNVAAQYTIGLTDTVSLGAGNLALFGGLLVWPTGLLSGTPPVAMGNFQVIERLAIYQTMGQTYDVIEANLDTVTTVSCPTHATVYADNAVFEPIIPLQFKIDKGSGGAFAFTFQVPVYALLRDASTIGVPEAPQWSLRPAHGQPQYLLDDGKNAGGAVLMGVGIGGIDWLEINVIELGFTN
jgi:hypothetical protein